MQLAHETTELTQNLTEQLRLILEATRATRFKGDYKSGKRINMRKVIPFIASNYRKDKIWLRRTKPSKRDYNVCTQLLNAIHIAQWESDPVIWQKIYTRI